MFGFCIAESSQKHEIGTEELRRFPAKTATRIALWYLASPDSVTSFALLDGVQNTQITQKIVVFSFYEECLGFVVPVISPGCTLCATHFNAE